MFCRAGTESIRNHFVGLLNNLGVIIFCKAMEVVQLFCVSGWSLILQVNEAANLVVVQHVEYLQLNNYFFILLSRINVGLAHIELFTKLDAHLLVLYNV